MHKRFLALAALIEALNYEKFMISCSDRWYNGVTSTHWLRRMALAH
jgi:hypothetical protein